MAGKKKLFKKILLITGAIILILFLGGLVFGYSILRSGLPVYEGTVEVEGLKQQVTIYRDELGRPHVYASTLEDLFFGQGYVHAQDRLWQMELHRRAGQGRISEVIGRSELNTDILLRTVGLPQVAAALKENSTPQTVAILDSYARGVNAYLEQMRGVPPEFRLLGFKPEPWTVDQVFGVAALMAFDSASNYQNELFRLTLEQELPGHLFQEMIPPAYPENDVPVPLTTAQLPDSVEAVQLISVLERLEFADSNYYPSLGLGSNGWAVAPGRSSTGNALFAFDSHDSLSLPTLYYENRLVLVDEFDLYGWSAVGMAAMIDGFSNQIAWGLTNIGDTQDLFLEERHPENQYQFRYGDQWYEAEVIVDSINVKGMEEPHQFEIIITRNGPLISEDPPISLAWSALHSEEGFDALLEINLAKSWEEFRAAANKFTMPSTNFNYADAEGNIAFRTVGLIPIRLQGTGVVISPGWDPAYGWDGFIPMEEMPELVNPPQEFIAAANALAAREDYPYLISVDNAPGYRMRRIVSFLESINEHSLDTMKQLQTDWYNEHAKRRLPDFIEALHNHSGELNDTEQIGLQLLESWLNEPVNAADLAAPAIFELWYLKLVEEVFLAEMGEELFQSFLRRNYIVYENLERFIERGQSAWFKADLDTLLLNSYQQTINDLVVKLGPDPTGWRWDQLQTISYNHDVGNELGPLSGIFNRGPYPSGGGHMTVGRAGHRLHNPFSVSHVSTIRVVADMGSEIEAYGVIPAGQSGHPLSKHYDDQVNTWLSGQYYPLYHNQVPPNAKTLVLEPR